MSARGGGQSAQSRLQSVRARPPGKKKIKKEFQAWRACYVAPIPSPSHGHDFPYRRRKFLTTKTVRAGAPGACGGPSRLTTSSRRRTLLYAGRRDPRAWTLPDSSRCRSFRMREICLALPLPRPIGLRRRLLTATSAPTDGQRIHEALREVNSTSPRGRRDMVMVSRMPYLDIVRRVKAYLPHAALRLQVSRLNPR